MLNKEKRRFIRNLVTDKDLAEIFGVSGRMTIYRWRKEKGLEKLEITIPGYEKDSIRFELDAVLAWAKENEIQTPGLVKWKQARKEARSNPA